jgi:ABC-2 type transport system permease protein
LRLARVWRIAQGVCTRFYRDPRVLWTLLLVPVGTLLLIGYVMRNTEEDVTAALVVAGGEWSTLDTASFIEESLDADGVATFRVPTRDAAERAVRDGRAEGYLVIDDTVARGVLGGEQQTVAVGVVGDDRSASERVLTALGLAVSAAPLKVFRGATGAEPLPPEGPIEFDTTYLYGGEEYDALDHVIPALLAFSALLSIFTVSVVAFTNERAQHTLERLMATALRRTELMLGYVLSYSAVALVQAGAILLVAFAVLRVHHAGNLGVVFLLTVATAVAALTLGFFLSGFAQTEAQAMQMLPLALVPQFVLSGVLFPLESLPEILRVLARFLPMTYSVSAMREVMIKDQGLLDAGVAGNLAVLLAFAAVFLVAGARSLKREVG